MSTVWFPRVERVFKEFEPVYISIRSVHAINCQKTMVFIMSMLMDTQTSSLLCRINELLQQNCYQLAVIDRYLLLRTISAAVLSHLWTLIRQISHRVHITFALNPHQAFRLVARNRIQRSQCDDAITRFCDMDFNNISVPKILITLSICQYLNENVFHSF